MAYTVWQQQSAAVHLRPVAGTGAGDKAFSALAKGADMALLRFSPDGAYPLVGNLGQEVIDPYDRRDVAFTIDTKARTVRRPGAGGNGHFATWAPAGHALVFLSRSTGPGSPVNLCVEGEPGAAPRTIWSKPRLYAGDGGGRSWARSTIVVGMDSKLILLELGS